MKMLELVTPPDDRALYRQVATMAIEGDSRQPKKAAAIELYETSHVVDGVTGPATPPTKEDIAKLVATLRSRLASVDMGRFSVSHSGGAIAYVTVNASPVRKRAAKKAAPAPKAPAAPKK